MVFTTMILSSRACTKDHTEYGHDPSIYSGHVHCLGGVVYLVQNKIHTDLVFYLPLQTAPGISLEMDALQRVQRNKKIDVHVLILWQQMLCLAYLYFSRRNRKYWPKATKPKMRENQVLHPYSRKAAQLTRREHHHTRVDKRKKESSLRVGLQGEKVAWIRDNLAADKEEFDKGDVLELMEKYLGRFEDELEQINLTNSIKGRKGRQHASREDNIKMIQEKEQREFDVSGLEIPDLFQKENVAYLRNWNGELRYLSNIKMTTVKRAHLK